MLDRDGTIIEDRDYPGDADAVTLLPGAAEAIRLLAARGIPAVVITNQSGIARGLITLEQYRAVRLRTEALLAEQGAYLLDRFACPHHPDFTGPCGCRKPGLELYQRAAALHRLDLGRCLFAGDRARDVLPARDFGGVGVLVESPTTSDADRAAAREIGASLAPSLLQAVRSIFGPTP